MTDEEVNSSWNECHIDIWFQIAKYLRPEDTKKFALICERCRSVTDSEAFWRSLFSRYVISKYPWLDFPGNGDGTSLRDETIRELFKSYPPFAKRKINPESYDKATNKILLQVSHTFDEVLKVRSYSFRINSRFSSLGNLPKKNRDEGCQLLLIKTHQFVPVPYESDNLVIKSVNKTLSRGLRSYKLTIKFCDHFGNQAGETLVFDPILSVYLIDWWHPNYKT